MQAQQGYREFKERSAQTAQLTDCKRKLNESTRGLVLFLLSLGKLNFAVNKMSELD